MGTAIEATDVIAHAVRPPAEPFLQVRLRAVWFQPPHCVSLDVGPAPPAHMRRRPELIWSAVKARRQLRIDGNSSNKFSHGCPLPVRRR